MNAESDRVGLPWRTRTVQAARRLSPCVGLGLLGACAAIAPRPADADLASIEFAIPPAWSVSVDAPGDRSAALERWWLGFDDPLLNRLQDQARQANTTLQTARAALAEARALSDATAAGLWPTLGLSAAAQRSTAGQTYAANDFSAGLNAGWVPDLFGGQRSGVEASRALARASAASLGAAQSSIAAELALDYIALRSAQARLQIARDNLTAQEETLQFTEWRWQAGLLTELETAQARSAVEQTRALLPAWQTGIAQGAHAMAVLTGQPPAELLVELAAPGPLPALRDELLLDLPADTLLRRADVRAAEEQVRAALATLDQTDAARRPSLALNASLGLNALTLGGLSNPAAVVSSVLASVAWPLFDGGAGDAQVRAQQAAVAQARSTWQTALLTALREVEDALVAMRGDSQRVQQLQRSASASALAFQLARQRFDSGLIDFQTVLDTQRSLLTSQDSAAGAAADLSADQVRLFQALGGGWPGRPPAADAPPGPVSLRTDPS